MNRRCPHTGVENPIFVFALDDGGWIVNAHISAAELVKQFLPIIRRRLSLSGRRDGRHEYHNKSEQSSMANPIDHVESLYVSMPCISSFFSLARGQRQAVDPNVGQLDWRNHHMSARIGITHMEGN